MASIPFLEIGGLQLSYSIPLYQEQVKLRTSNFAATFIGSIGTNAHENVGIVAVGVVRESRKFSGHPFIGHCAVIFASTAFLYFSAEAAKKKYRHNVANHDCRFKPCRYPLLVYRLFKYVKYAPNMTVI